MLKSFMMAIIVLSFGVSLYAEKFTEGFEDKTVLKKWEVEGDAVISTDQKHGGTKSLFVPKGSKAIWMVSKDNKFGTAIFWVYDSKVGKVKGLANGPKWGIRNSDEETLILGLVNRPGSAITWGSYFWQGLDRYDWWYDSAFVEKNIKQGWHKITFNLPDEKTTEISLDDEKTAVVDMTKSQFTKGFSGICFEGGKHGEETFYFDDIEITFK